MDYVPDVSLLVRQIDVRRTNANHDVEMRRADLFRALDSDVLQDIADAARAYECAYRQIEALNSIYRSADRLIRSPAGGVAGVPHEIINEVLFIIQAYDEWRRWVPQQETGDE